MTGRARVVAIATVAVLLTSGVLTARQSPPAGRGDVLIFAAASLQTALDQLAPAIERAAGIPVRTSYAATSALARQIENGAPADIFVSADLDWMNYLDDRRLIRRDARVDLLSNALVLIAPSGRRPSVAIGPGFQLAAALGRERLAIADPTAVPAGKYAQAALTSLGVWDLVATKLATTENVRAALLLVSRGETPLGIVYKTDALADRGVVIVDTFPPTTHPRIVYPAALTSGASAPAALVLTFLHGSEAKAVFASQGFITDFD